MCIQGLLLTLNDLHIMVTLGIYFEHVKVLCQIFTKYITTILQVYPSYFLILPKIITNDIYCYLLLSYLLLLINLNFKIHL